MGNRKLEALVPAETSSAEATRTLGRQVAGRLGPGSVVALYGDLGAGKTQFVKGAAAALGIDERDVRSPTFVIAREYDGRWPEGHTQAGATARLYHLDAYRLGGPSDLRAVDYDDWVTPTEKGPGLNGDIIVWDDVRETALELSSMGIRVDAEALAEQMEIVGRDEDDTLPYRERILDGTLPLSVGGGIGQSRVAMFLLKKAHIGEVQPSAWPDETVEAMQERGVPLL
ncbi:MAG: tRNA (adenosine(37)-N6)-threonylcarbamoyltransferase complex ATPase subunit type 1 TsaE [Bacteroidetes bacterium QH_2_67_10]|nr:MAG: tRNA (adenosine(37)-N6)-threonylcarbamoyltransferase complex ATPase subunit type 1 TsaE [Bacteroidetes bacterium QH_2_67_10]